MAATARSELADLADWVGSTHEPHVVDGREHRAILVPEEDWLGLLATLELMRVPGMVQSILDAAQEPTEDMTRFEDIPW